MHVYSCIQSLYCRMTNKKNSVVLCTFFLVLSLYFVIKSNILLPISLATFAITKAKKNLLSLLKNPCNYYYILLLPYVYLKVSLRMVSCLLCLSQTWGNEYVTVYLFTVEGY